MRVGIVILPEHRWWAGEPLWRMAEEYGFDHAWTYDTLGWPPLLDKPWFDPLPTLSAAATVTSEIRLGMLGTTAHVRHPAHFARELTALDDLSDGRLTVGLSAYGLENAVRPFDSQVVGRSLGQEFDTEESAGEENERFEEFLELLHQVLTQDSTTWKGQHFSAIEARRAPGCVQHPRVPFILAGHDQKSLALTARYGSGWIAGVGDHHSDRANPRAWWREMGQRSDQLTRALAEAGRGPASVTRYLLLDASGTHALSSVEHFRDCLGRARELGFTDVITHWPRPEEPFAGSESVLEDIASGVLAK